MEAEYLREQESESAGARGFSQLVNGMNVYRVEVVRLRTEMRTRSLKSCSGKSAGARHWGAMMYFPCF